MPMEKQTDMRNIVVKCGGSLIENERTGSGILDDIARITGAGTRPVLVHGGSVQADRDMEAAGIEPRRYKGLRITCEKTIAILDRCFGRLNGEIVEKLKSRGVAAVGFSGTKGSLIRAEVITPDGVDIGLVGDMTGIDRDAWAGAPPEAVPVVASLGVDSQGRTLNINADYVATRLALEIKAEKLILMTDVDGVLLDVENPGSRIPELNIEKARSLIEDGTIAKGMIPKIESAIRAIEDGIPEIIMINGRTPGALFTALDGTQATGTRIKN